MTHEHGPIRYSMLIQWSNEDDAYLVTFPEWEGRVINPVTHGDTYEEAARNGLLAIEDLVAVALECAETLPDVNPAVVAA